MKGIKIKTVGKGLLGAGAISVPVSTLALVIENRDNLEELKLDFTNKVDVLQTATLNAVLENKQLIEQNNKYTSAVLLMLRSKLTELMAKIEEVRKQIKTNKLYIGKLDEAITKLETKEEQRFKALHGALIDYKNKLDVLIKKPNSVDTKEIENKIKNINNRLDEGLKVNITIGGNSQQIYDLTNALSQYQQSLTDDSTRIMSTYSQTLETTIKDFQTTLNNVKQVLEAKR